MVIIVPLGQLLRGRPEDYGCYPDGVASASSSKAANSDVGGHTRAQALRTGVFWALTLPVMLNGLVVTAVFFHVDTVFADRIGSSLPVFYYSSAIAGGLSGVLAGILLT